MKKTIFLLIIFVLLFTGCNNKSNNISNVESSSSQNSEINSQIQENFTNVTKENDVYSAMWISYLEWETVDFSTKESFTNEIEIMFENCKNMNINTIIAQVRPFGDALYNSKISPTSHLITGVQGDEILYDPLEIMVEKAHEKNLKIEAWVNPYRIQLTQNKPKELASNNKAIIYMENNETTHYVFEANNGLYYNPAVPEVRQLIVDGVNEIVTNYNIDAIHFDDYFYPEGAGSTFDLEMYNNSGSNLSLDAWRRENVNKLIQTVYNSIKTTNKEVVFGVSPQGNNDNNYNMQYSDIDLWLKEPGYVDYIMPQLYWGYDFVLKSGNDRFSYLNILNEWLTKEKNENVKLYIGLGAYRIDAGDGSYKESDEWQTGNNISNMISDAIINNANGIALYRYDFLFKNTEYNELAKQEVENIGNSIK